MKGSKGTRKTMAKANVPDVKLDKSLFGMVRKLSCVEMEQKNNNCKQLLWTVVAVRNSRRR